MRRKPVESQVLQACMKRLSYTRELVAWRQNTGAARPEDTRVMNAVLGMLRRGDQRGAIAALMSYAPRRGQSVRFGTKGQPDITGWVTQRARRLPSGARFELEIKRPGGKPDDDQVAHLLAVREAGGVADVVDDVEQIEAVLGGERVWNP